MNTKHICNAGNTRINAMRPGPHGTYFLALAIGMSLWHRVQGCWEPQVSQQGTLGGWGDIEEGRTDYGRVWPWGISKDSIGTNMESLYALGFPGQREKCLPPWAGTEKWFWISSWWHSRSEHHQDFPRGTWADSSLLLIFDIFLKSGDSRWLPGIKWGLLAIRSVTLALLQEKVWEEGRERLVMRLLILLICVPGLIKLKWQSRKKNHKDF